MFVVCVSFTTNPGRFDEFMPLVVAQANTSVTAEKDCHQFDVCRGEDNEVFLYEVYADEAAFSDHLKTAHFHKFDQTCKDLIKSKTVKTYSLESKWGPSS